MPGDALDRDVERLEADERQREDAWRRVETAIDRGALTGTYAGRWVSDDGEWLVVAVTTNPDEASARLRGADAHAPVRVVSHPRTLESLKDLQDRVKAAGDRLRAPVACTAVDVRSNVVEVALEDLDLPASQKLKTEFAAAHIRWITDTVTAC